MVLAYDMPLWRPPSEGNNLIIQATIGCSFNACTFCAMYKTKQYRARPLDKVFADIDVAAAAYPEARRVFLADGDALVLPTDHLLRILDKLAEAFPGLNRVSAYATPMNLKRKTEAELASLVANGLGLAYLGVESGSADILKRIRKGATPETIVLALNKASTAGMKISATVILGLGGRHRWKEHVDATADVINQAPPRFLSTLQLHLDDSVADEFIDRMADAGEPFELQGDDGILAEQERFLNALDPPADVIFRSNHASNCLPLAGRLPVDRHRLVASVHAAQSDRAGLRPEWLRGL